jgi:hypothetical protein
LFYFRASNKLIVYDSSNDSQDCSLITNGIFNQPTNTFFENSANDNFMYESYLDEQISKYNFKTKLNTGNDTIDNLSITEHSLGTSTRSQSPNDLSLGNEVAREQVFNKILSGRRFLSDSQFGKDVANGLQITE